MSAVTMTERPPLPGFDPGARAPAEAEREMTLDELLVVAWQELRTHRAAACPVCGETMNPVYGAHTLPFGGRCAACGSELR